MSRDLIYQERPQVKTVSSLALDFMTWRDLPSEYS